MQLFKKQLEIALLLLVLQSILQNWDRVHKLGLDFKYIWTQRCFRTLAFLIGFRDTRAFGRLVPICVH